MKIETSCTKTTVRRVTYNNEDLERLALEHMGVIGSVGVALHWTGFDLEVTVTRTEEVQE